MVDQEQDATDEQQESPGKGLRAQLEQALADKKALEAQLSEFKGKVRKSEVTQVLAAKGVNSKIAKFIPEDVEGDEAIGKWLEDNADVFGFQTQASDENASNDPVTPSETVQSAQRMQTLGQNATSPGKLADIEVRMANAKTDAELNELWVEAQKFML